MGKRMQLTMDNIQLKGTAATRIGGTQNNHQVTLAFGYGVSIVSKSSLVK
jgi:hypothetical protein